MYEPRKSDRGAVIVVPIDEKTGRIVLVMERSKPEPHYWKFPGGGIDPCDTDPAFPDDNLRAADNAARRETAEETGMRVGLMRLATIQKRTHTVYAYIGLGNVNTLREMGADGEIPKTFSEEQIMTLTNLMPSHKAILDMALEKIKA